MTETRSTGVPTQRDTSSVPEPTAWVGWILFAGVMLILLGTFQAIAGFVGIFDKSYYVATPNQLVLHMSYTAWGWTHLVLGVAAVAAGYGVMAGKTWARIYAIILAGISAIANLMFIGAYPVWGVIIITFDVLVIWALALHGHEVERVE